MIFTEFANQGRADRFRSLSIDAVEKKGSNRYLIFGLINYTRFLGDSICLFFGKWQLAVLLRYPVP